MGLFRRGIAFGGPEKQELREPPVNVRFWDKSGHSDEMALLPLLTRTGHEVDEMRFVPSPYQKPHPVNTG
jgi:hypothetical protein